jgi:hypothetical protein
VLAGYLTTTLVFIVCVQSIESHQETNLALQNKYKADVSALGNKIETLTKALEEAAVEKVRTAQWVPGERLINVLGGRICSLISVWCTGASFSSCPPLSTNSVRPLFLFLFLRPFVSPNLQAGMQLSLQKRPRPATTPGPPKQSSWGGQMRSVLQPPVARAAGADPRP